MSIFSKLFTKTVKVEGKEDDFVSVIRFTKIPHGPFLTSTDKDVKWGSFRFGKPHGPICTAIPKFGAIRSQVFNKGKETLDEVVSIGENDKGVPFRYIELHRATDKPGYHFNTQAFRVAKFGNLTIQKILVEEANVTKNSKATPETVVLRYEPTIGANIYPVVVNSYKDIEVGKMYTRWFRVGHDGTMRLIAMARSSMEEDNEASEFGYKGEFDEIVLMVDANKRVLQFASRLPTSEEKFAKFAAGKFGTAEYEAIKEEEGSAGLIVTFTETCGIIGTVSATNKETNETKELSAKLRRADVDLLLWDLQRGSGEGIAEVRAFIVAQQPDSGEGEVSGSGEEDIQCSGSEAQDIPSGDENGSESTDGIQPDTAGQEVS